MSEKLIPFDLEAYRADKTRLRFVKGSKPIDSMEVDSLIAVVWEGNGWVNSYSHNDYSHHLRLAARTRTVKVRPWLDGTRMVLVSDQVGVIDCDGHNWRKPISATINDDGTITVEVEE